MQNAGQFVALPIAGYLSDRFALFNLLSSYHLKKLFIDLVVEPCLYMDF